MPIKTSSEKSKKKARKTWPRKPIIKGKTRNKPTVLPKDWDVKKVGRPIRPSKMTDQVVQKIIQFIKYDWTERDACRYAVVPWTTYMWWKKKNYICSYQFTTSDQNGAKTTAYEDIWFADLIDYAKLQLTSSARFTLAKAVDAWNLTAAIEVLKRRDQRYRDKIEQDNTGTFNINFGWPQSRFKKKQPPTWDDENDENQ